MGGSAALVSLALFGAFVARAGISVEDASILNAKVFPGLLLGAMLPYWFSAMTMKAVGQAALEMVEEVRRQFRTIPGIMQGTNRPDYDKCVSISTRASLVAMGGPGALVLLTPIVVGVLFGTQTLCGVLVGALVSVCRWLRRRPTPAVPGTTLRNTSRRERRTRRRTSAARVRTHTPPR